MAREPSLLAPLRLHYTPLRTRDPLLLLLFKKKLCRTLPPVAPPQGTRLPHTAMSQAARPSLTVAQLHTPLTNIPTLAHALTSGDRLDKVGIHQLLSGFAERSDGKTWDFTVSRKRSRAKAEPSNDTDDDDDGVDEQEQVVDEEEEAPSAPTTPTTPTPTTTTTHRAKRQRRGAARASPSFDERQDTGESAVTKGRGKAKAKKVEVEEGDKENNHNHNSSSSSNNRNRVATSTRSSRSRGRVAQKTTPRNSRRRKELKFEDDEERPAAETEKEEKVRSDDAQVDQHEHRTTTTTTTTAQAYVPGNEPHQGSYLAFLQEAFVPASDRLSVLGDDGRYDPARLYHIPHPVGRRHSHSLIFPLLHSLEHQQPHQHQHQHRHPYDDSLYDYKRYSHSHAAVAPTPIFASTLANNTALFAPPPTPPPPPTGTWYSMLIDHSIPAPPPPPAPLNVFQTAASPQLTPSSARHYHHHYPSSPSMPLSSPEYGPQHYYTYGGERAPSPHTTLGGGDHPWAWLSEAGEEQILQFLRSTPAQSEPQPTFYHQQQHSGAEMDQMAPSVEPGRLLLGFESESEEARRAMAKMRMSLARLREAAVAAASPMMSSWATNNPPSGFATSFPPLVDHAASQPRFSLASSSSSRSASPYHFGRASGGALPHFYGGGHCSMPSSASSSQPSSPYTVDMEIPYATTLPSVDLSLSASPLLLPVLHTTAAATTSMATTTRPRTPSSLLRSTTSRRRRSPTTGQAATTSTSTAQTPKRRKNAPKANDGR